MGSDTMVGSNQATAGFCPEPANAYSNEHGFVRGWVHSRIVEFIYGIAPNLPDSWTGQIWLPRGLTTVPGMRETHGLGW